MKWFARLATPEDVPALEKLIPISAHALQRDHYSAKQIEAAMGPVFGVDAQLIKDRTFYVVEDSGQIIGCGGWSRRASKFGGDEARAEPDPELDPKVDAARVRAFFIDPKHARRGVGSAIMATCEEAIHDAGFSRVEIVATLSGEPLYAKFGYETIERFGIPLDGAPDLPAARMTKQIDVGVPQVVSTQDGYDAWSEFYDDENNPLVTIEAELVQQLLGEVDGISVADVGCGTGRHALELAAQGANVTAVDFSEGMLDKARSKPGAEAVNWVQHDLQTGLPFADASFDRVISCLVFDHVRNLDFAMGEMRRVCRPSGFLVISTFHPFLNLRGSQARFIDRKTGQRIQPASVEHDISAYVLAANRAGLSIEEMSEHRVDEALAEKSPRSRKYLGWPCS
ncbi:MAG: ubiquinone/menaquinone biosynthesis C-methylase UbiE [Verrucomicrobiales bacterium]|jgi:ubiquinone/menaquinone biosynthesis C-methylase UbiE/N-acetylglutamate synthase-like GNAT family acetyltransferase